MFATGLEAWKCVQRSPLEDVDAFSAGLKVLVLDEVDRLVQAQGRHAPLHKRGTATGVKTTRQELSRREGRNDRVKKDTNRHEAPTSMLLRSLAQAGAGKRSAFGRRVQIIGASATVGRPLRRLLPTLLGIDQDAVPVVRPRGETQALRPALDGKSRMVYMPEGLRHELRRVEDGRLDALLDAALVAVDAHAPERCLLMLPQGSSVKSMCKRLGQKGRTALALFEQMGFRSGSDGDAASVGNLVQSYERLRGDGKRGAGPTIIVGRQDVVRGLHLDNMDLVCLLGVPSSVDDYFHIAGRTGRCGRAGRVITVAQTQASKRLLSWQKMMGVAFEVHDA